MNRVQERYNEEIIPALMKNFDYSSVMQVPKLSKIVLNMGVGDAKEDSKAIDNAIEDLTTIAGQKAVVTQQRNPSQTLSCGRYAHRCQSNFAR